MSSEPSTKDIIVSALIYLMIAAPVTVVLILLIIDLMRGSIK